MNKTRCARLMAAGSARRLLLLLVLIGINSVALADPPPTVVDSQSIVRSLKPPSAPTRSIVVAARTPPPASKIDLDIRFANDSDRLTSAAHEQLAELGAALSSPDLAQTKFLIAGHTSATGAPDHNQRLSESRARAVRSYLLEHYKIAPDRLETTGYGSSHLLPDFPPEALQQRRVEVSALPPSS